MSNSSHPNKYEWDDWKGFDDALELLTEFDKTGVYEKDLFKYEKPISPKRELRRLRWEAWKLQETALEQVIEFIETGVYTKDGKQFVAQEMLRHVEGYARCMDFVNNNLRNWIKEDDDRVDLVKSARRLAADKMAQGSLDVIVQCDEESNISVSRAKAESDARKWLAGCIDNVYSNRTETTIKGDKDSPLQTQNTTTLDVSGLTDEQLKVIASIKINPD